MAAIATRKALRTAQRATTKAKNALAEFQERNARQIETGTRAVTAVGSAFTVAALEGRYPEYREVMGVPVSLLIGGAAHLAAIMGWSGDEETPAGRQGRIAVESVGTGCLAVFAATQGFRIGHESAQSQ